MPNQIEVIDLIDSDSDSDDRDTPTVSLKDQVIELLSDSEESESGTLNVGKEPIVLNRHDLSNKTPPFSPSNRKRTNEEAFANGSPSFVSKPIKEEAIVHYEQQNRKPRQTARKSALNAKPRLSFDRDAVSNRPPREYVTMPASDSDTSESSIDKPTRPRQTARKSAMNAKPRVSVDRNVALSFPTGESVTVAPLDSKTASLKTTQVIQGNLKLSAPNSTSERSTQESGKSTTTSIELDKEMEGTRSERIVGERNLEDIIGERSSVGAPLKETAPSLQGNDNDRLHAKHVLHEDNKELSSCTPDATTPNMGGRNHTQSGNLDIVANEKSIPNRPTDGLSRKEHDSSAASTNVASSTNVTDNTPKKDSTRKPVNSLPATTEDSTAGRVDMARNTKHSTGQAILTTQSCTQGSEIMDSPSSDNNVMLLLTQDTTGVIQKPSDSTLQIATENSKGSNEALVGDSHHVPSTEQTNQDVNVNTAVSFNKDSLAIVQDTSGTESTLDVVSPTGNKDRAVDVTRKTPQELVEATCSLESTQRAGQKEAIAPLESDVTVPSETLPQALMQKSSADTSIQVDKIPPTTNKDTAGPLTQDLTSEVLQSTSKKSASIHTVQHTGGQDDTTKNLRDSKKGSEGTKKGMDARNENQLNDLTMITGNRNDQTLTIDRESSVSESTGNKESRKANNDKAKPLTGDEASEAVEKTLHESTAVDREKGSSLNENAMPPTPDEASDCVENTPKPSMQETKEGRGKDNASGVEKNAAIITTRTDIVANGTSCDIGIVIPNIARLIMEETKTSLPSSEFQANDVRAQLSVRPHQDSMSSKKTGKTTILDQLQNHNQSVDDGGLLGMIQDSSSSKESQKHGERHDDEVIQTRLDQEAPLAQGDLEPALDGASDMTSENNSPAQMRQSGSMKDSDKPGQLHLKDKQACQRGQANLSEKADKEGRRKQSVDNERPGLQGAGPIAELSAEPTGETGRGDLSLNPVARSVDHGTTANEHFGATTKAVGQGQQNEGAANGNICGKPRDAILVEVSTGTTAPKGITVVRKPVVSPAPSRLEQRNAEANEGSLDNRLMVPQANPPSIGQSGNNTNSFLGAVRPFSSNTALPEVNIVYGDRDSNMDKYPRPIEQVCLKTGVVLKSFESLASVAKYLGLTNWSLLNYYTEHGKPFRGFQWRFKEVQYPLVGNTSIGTNEVSVSSRKQAEFSESNPSHGVTVSETFPNNGSPVPVEQVCLETGVVLRAFDSISSAAMSLGLKNGSLLSYYVNKGRPFGGFHWRFKKCQYTGVDNNRVGVTEGSVSSRKEVGMPESNPCQFQTNSETESLRLPRPVEQICLKTGNVLKAFDSLASAAMSLGLTNGSLLNYYTKQDRPFRGFKWRFKEERTAGRKRKEPDVFPGCQQSAIKMTAKKQVLNRTQIQNIPLSNSLEDDPIDSSSDFSSSNEAQNSASTVKPAISASSLASSADVPTTPVTPQHKRTARKAALNQHTEGRKVSINDWSDSDSDDDEEIVLVKVMKPKQTARKDPLRGLQPSNRGEDTERPGKKSESLHSTDTKVTKPAKMVSRKQSLGQMPKVATSIASKRPSNDVKSPATVSENEDGEPHSSVVNATSPGSGRETGNSFALGQSPVKLRKSASRQAKITKREIENMGLMEFVVPLSLRTSHKTTINSKTGYPTSKFSCFSGQSEDILYDFQVEVRESGIPNSGLGAFLTYQGARKLRPEKKVCGNDLIGLKRFQPMSEPLTALGDDGFGINVNLERSYINEETNLSGPNSAGASRTMKKSDYIADPGRLFSSYDKGNGLIDLGRYGPLTKNDRKDRYHFDVKSFVFNHHPSEWCFGVEERLFGKTEQIIDITSDSTGTTHDTAMKNLPMYVNEVGHNPRLRQNVFALEKDDRAVHYYIMIKDAMKEGETVELLTDYSDAYEDVRERKGYGYRNVKKGLPSDEDIAMRTVRNHGDRANMAAIFSNLKAQGLYDLMEFVECQIRVPLSKITDLNFITPTESTIQHWIAMRRLQWLGQAFECRLRELKVELALVSPQFLDVFPLSSMVEQCFEWAEKLRWTDIDDFLKMMDDSAVRIRETLHMEIAEEISYELRDYNLMPFNRAMWCPIGINLFQDLCACVREANACRIPPRGQGKLTKAHLQTKAKEAASQVREAVKLVANDVSPLVFQIAHDEPPLIPKRAIEAVRVELFHGNIMWKGSVAAVLDKKGEQSPLPTIPLPRDQRVLMAKCPPGVPSASMPIFVGNWVKSQHVDVYWYLLWQVAYPVHVFAKTFLPGCDYKLEDIFADVGLKEELKKELSCAEKNPLPSFWRQAVGADRPPRPPTESSPKQPRPKPDVVWRGAPDDPLPGGWPAGWIKELHQRKGGATKGHCDRYWFSPKEHRKFRSMVEIHRFMACLRHTNGDEVQAYILFKKS